MDHPLSKFRFCPVCGSSQWHEHDEKSKQCGRCGFEYYMNPSAATAAFIVNDRRELLVVRRAKLPAKDTLDLPGGFVDIGEDTEQGMCREIREETGLTVGPGQLEYLFSTPNEYLYSGMLIYTIDADYLVRVSSTASAVAADDAADARWLPLGEVRPADFGLLSIRRAVERFLAMVASGRCLL